MFDGATEFSADISRWDVSRAQEFTRMFDGAASFNADVSKWAVFQVISDLLKSIEIILLGLTISKRHFFAKSKTGIRVYDFKNTKLGFTILNREFC